MNPIISLYNVIINSISILKKQKTVSEKTSILFYYFKLSATWLFAVKILGIKKNKEKIFGRTMHFFDYEVFSWLFYEMFIRQEYMFTTTTKNPVIIDCGSNIGMSVLFFKKLFPTSKIICFEPNHDTAELLKQNISENKFEGITCHEAAVTDNKGVIPFYVDKTKKGILAMSTINDLKNHNADAMETTVRTVQLSQYIKEPVDFLKLDIEGAETCVIEDLSKHKKLQDIERIFIEYHFSVKNKKNSVAKITQILEENGFYMLFNCLQEPPFEQYQEKPYNLLIYAYKKKIILIKRI
ncbi:MAG: FkbM family methyltransferase [Candidatus Woesearchaeota archaeon]